MTELEKAKATLLLATLPKSLPCRNKYVDIWEGGQTYYWESYPFYEGYSVSIKEGVEKTDKLQKAVDAIRSLDSIFSLDYSCNS